MAPSLERLFKCCVSNCTSTSITHRLFNIPKDDKLRSLWLSFLVPVNSELIMLTKEQLKNKRVCQKHFDKYQFDRHGNRLQNGYPCLFSSKEIKYGLPLNLSVGYPKSDHNYSTDEIVAKTSGTSVIVTGHSEDHWYTEKDCINSRLKSSVAESKVPRMQNSIGSKLINTRSKEKKKSKKSTHRDKSKRKIKKASKKPKKKL